MNNTKKTKDDKKKTNSKKSKDIKAEEKSVKKNSSKKKGKTTIHLKSSVRDLIILLVLVVVLGLIFMNPLFTLIMAGGIILILLVSHAINRIKHKWIKVILNIFAILLLLCCIGGVGFSVWFIKYIKDNAP